jgi:hypothetical protein
MNLLIVAVIVVLLNLPFGFWRAGVKKFSWQWFVAIHLPVPIVIAIRIFSGLGFALVSYPVLIGAFFLGQFIGARIGRVWNRSATQTHEADSISA